MTKRKNSMDDIIIRYGQPQKSRSDRYQEISFRALTEGKPIEELQREVEEKIKEIPLPDFLKLKKERLLPMHVSPLIAKNKKTHSIGK